MKRKIKQKRLDREWLMRDLSRILKDAIEKNYHFSMSDSFALGYLAGKYNLRNLYNNQEKVIEACRDYDRTDDLALLDTIGETLIDLQVIDNSKGIL